MNLNLEGKTALVCGSSQGIGEAIAIALSRQKANIVLLARRQHKLQNVLNKLDPTGNHQMLVADLDHPDSFIQPLQEMCARIGGIHILVNNASGPDPGQLLSANPEDFQKMFQRHVISSDILANLTIPNMKRDKFGRIINVISISVKVPLPQFGLSNTIRGAVANWAKTLSNEVASYGITVNNVLPGFTRTPRIEALIKESAEAFNKTEEEIIQRWIHTIPAARLGEVEDIADAVAFLASPAASYINGINLPVDGGKTPCL